MICEKSEDMTSLWNIETSAWSLNFLLFGWWHPEVTFLKMSGSGLSMTALWSTGALSVDAGLGGLYLDLQLGFGFFILLVLHLKVVLGQIAVLAHTAGVVRSVGMAASSGHLCLTFPVVAVVAHVLGIVLLVSVWALIDLSPLPLSSDGFILWG